MQKKKWKKSNNVFKIKTFYLKLNLKFNFLKLKTE